MREAEMNKAGYRALAPKVIMILFFVGCLLYPILQVLCNITPTALKEVVGSEQFQGALTRSLTTTLTATALSIVLACIAAWAVVRTNMVGRNFFAVLFTVPMLIPSYSHASGLIMLFGQSGLLTKALHLDELFGTGTYIYGFWGVVIGCVMFAMPVAFIMIADIMKYQDSTPYEAADVLGIPRKNQFFAITYPYYRKPMISVIFVVFTAIITDYGVPHIIGGQFSTLASLMYNNTIKLLDYEKGGIYGAVLLIPAALSFILDFANKDKGNLAFIGKPFEIKPKLGRDLLALLASAALMLLMFLPIFSAGWRSLTAKYPVDMSLTLAHYGTVIFKSGFRYLFNSLLIASVVAVGGVAVAYVDAYLTVRMKTKASRVLHLLTMTTMAVPGIVLGLSYVMVFKGSFIYNTFIILMLVNMVHMFATPYLMLYNTFGKLNENLEDVGTTLGIGRLRMIKDVIIPITQTTIWDAMAYFFAQCMKTITAVAFLWTSRTKPLALKMDEYNANVEVENVAVVTILILLINVLFKLLSYWRQQAALKNKNKLGKVAIPEQYAVHTTEN